MKKLILLFALLPAFSIAQESYTVPVSAANVTPITQLVKAENFRTCFKLGLGLGCSQAAACTAAGISSSCTPAQARTASARIYIHTTTAGREEWFLFTIVQPVINDRAASLPNLQNTIRCAVWSTLTQAEKDTACARPENGTQDPGCNLGCN